MSIRIEDAPARERYEIYDGEALAGFTQYRTSAGVIALLHTQMEHEFEGKGLASQLIRFALEDAKSRDLHVLPFCPFVNGYIQRHQEWEELIPLQYRKGFASAGS